MSMPHITVVAQRPNIIIVIALIMLMALGCGGEKKAVREPVANITWDCGVDTGTVTCSLDSMGLLRVSGNGAMEGFCNERGYRSSIYASWCNSKYGKYKNVNRVVIEEGITQIGCWAFAGCTSVVSVAIPISVTEIGHGAFYDCAKLESVSIPDDITKISPYTFYGCAKLESLSIHGNITEIGSYAFYGCAKLESVSIHGNTTEIGIGAFANCGSLTSIEVAADNANYSSKDGVLFSKNKYQLIQYPSGIQGAYIIPNNVKVVLQLAFYNSFGLTSVFIPSSVNFIWGDFRKTYWYIKGYEYFEETRGMFSGCSSLRSIDVAAGTAYYSSKDGILFNKDKTELLWYPAAIQDTSYTIPNDVESIGKSAFEGNINLKSLTIGRGVTHIGRSAFSYSRNLMTITSLNPKPPQVRSSSDIAVIGNRACLYVPENSIEAYRANNRWKLFKCINKLELAHKE